MNSHEFIYLFNNLFINHVLNPSFIPRPLFFTVTYCCDDSEDKIERASELPLDSRLEGYQSDVDVFQFLTVTGSDVVPGYDASLQCY